ncbi:MAG: hypothetical protein NTV86_23075 [Planctomycetota bacterium]|nr:hypothetical protein [Planctomycetota bacterium]
MAHLTTEQLKAELARRQRALPKLLKKRARLEKLIEAIDAQIADASGEAAPAMTIAKRAKKPVVRRKTSKKPPREGSLKALLVAALTGKPGVGVGEAADAVLAAGYKSQLKDFHLLVNQALLNSPEFKKVSRGVFTVKGQSVADAVVKDAAKAGRKPKAASKPGAKPKGQGGKPLAAFVQEALANAPDGLSVTGIEKAVLAAGFPTKAKTVYDQVAKVLGKGGFKKVSRGVYVLKGS